MTPYRSEIEEIFIKNEYHKTSMFVPFSNGEERPKRYNWLAKIADEELWAETFEEAFDIAIDKGIEMIYPKKISLQFKQFRNLTFENFDDKDNKCCYCGMILQNLHNDTSENIGTYIVIDDNMVMVCD